ncbi:hypothetical protein V9R59_002751 [Vibrio harveyi]|uniref:hypothetical protein n=1 Tax=Vibrio harveyi TaxID=669 RepID=UPI003CF03D73|nr:hypothetical protein [Vibrio harveyi]
MTAIAERSNTFVNSSFKPMIAAGTLAVAALSSGYVHAEPSASQSTTTYYSKAPNINSLSDEYKLLDEYFDATNGNEAKSTVFFSSNASFLRSSSLKDDSIKIVDELLERLTAEHVSTTFYERVSGLADKLSLNKKQLAGVLNVERKSIYDWQKKPDVNVREATRLRVEMLEEFANSLDEGHSKYVSKLAFGSHADQELAQLLVLEDTSLDQLQDTYDRLWLKFDGFAARARIKAQTEHFEKADGFGELV